MANPPASTEHKIHGHRLPPSIEGNHLRQMIHDPLRFFENIVAQYGDIVCYRPAPEPAYLLNHPDYVRHVLLDNNRNYSKDTSSNRFFSKVVGQGLLTSEGETWRKQRRMMQPAFHHTRLEQLDRLIVDATESMLDGWQAAYESNQPVDIAREMAALTLTVTTHSLFGVDLGDEVRQVGESINQAANYLEKPSNPRLVQTVYELNDVVERIIQRRKQDFKDSGDLLSSMILARDETGKTGMDDEQLHSQVKTLLLAGYETTASSLTWTWYLLSQHLPTVDRLRREVRAALNGRPPRYADLERLPFASMVLSESLRLYPPAWTLGRRALGEDVIDGFYIPANSVIAICIYTLHRHPGFWERPDTFDPERFSSENAAGRHKFAYIPFGSGPRQCIGNTFGLMEAALVVASVLQRFELHLMPGIEVQPQPVFVLRANRNVLMSLHG